jgi:hypothetical protein
MTGGRPTWVDTSGRWVAWGVLLLVVAVYYPRFIKNPDGMVLYPEAASCLLAERAMAECAPRFTYPPIFAFLMIPFVPMPMWLRNLVWYALSISVIVWSVRLCESLTVNATGLERDRRVLWWFRGLSLLLSLKFMLAVLENQAYDYLVFFLIVVGIRGMVTGNKAPASLGLASAAALKATPVLFFPYLFYRKRWFLACATVVAFVGLSLLPDLFFSPSTGSSTYVGGWLSGIAGASLSGGGDAAVAQHFGGGENPLNQSLRSFVYRLLQTAGLLPYFHVALYAAYLVVLIAVWDVVRRSARLEASRLFDASAILVAMLLLSPMSSKSHFITLVLPYMLIVAVLCQRRHLRRSVGVVLGVSFALNSLTSRTIVGDAASDVWLSMGCVTIGTALVGVMIWLIVVDGTRSLPEGGSASRGPQSAGALA